MAPKNNNTTSIDLTPFIKLTGSTGAAESLLYAYTSGQDPIKFKPRNTVGLQHLVKLGYLKPDYRNGGITVMHDKISQDLESLN
jgi:hypothetical protein